LSWFKKLFNSEIFQGNLRNKNYFEGWYFKLVDLEEKNIYAVIPGVSLLDDRSSAFIQVLNGKTAESHYIEYPIQDFKAESDYFEVRIGENRFSLDGLELDIHSEEISVEGSVKYINPVRWKSSILKPGIMGWYSYVPFMKCYHGLVSMNHGLEEGLKVNGDLIDFTGGKGYSEKNWGQSFPKAHIWMQSNHFEDPEVSFMLSVGRIPWLGSSFTGFLGVLWRNGELLNMSTYTGARITRLSKESDRVQVLIENKEWALDVSVYRGQSGELKKPSLGDMKGRITESVDSTVNVRLFDNRLREIFYEGTGRNTGFELNDNDDILHAS